MPLVELNSFPLSQIKNTIWVIALLSIIISIGLIVFKINKTVLPIVGTTLIPTPFSPTPVISPLYELPGMQTNFPWNSGLEKLEDRLSAVGLPALTAEGAVLHTHQHLDIYINGRHVNLADSIGRDEKGGFIAPIHTHDNSGIIHVESPKVEKFTLGQFFDIWGVEFNDQCLGQYCVGDNNLLKVFVNGQPVTNNFRNVELLAHQEVVITYGSESELPNPIPASYQFLVGY